RLLVSETDARYNLSAVASRRFWPMPRLTDVVILGQFQVALANWNYTGYVTAKDVALDWIANNLVGLTLKDIARAMNDFLVGGGTIDRVPEGRPEWTMWPYHDDFRLSLAGSGSLYRDHPSGRRPQRSNDPHSEYPPGRSR